MGGLTVDSKELEHGHGTICHGVPSFSQVLGWRMVIATFWLLLYVTTVVENQRPLPAFVYRRFPCCEVATSWALSLQSQATVMRRFHAAAQVQGKGSESAEILSRLQRLPQPTSSKALEKLLDPCLPQFRRNPKLVPPLLKELRSQKRNDVAGEVVTILHASQIKLGLPEYTAGISACARAKKWQLALHLFGGMPKAKLDPTVISYNASISSCEKGQQWQLALHLFCAMPTAKVDPDVISYNASISSCEKGQQWQLALHLFCAMPTAKVDPNVISYNASISSCEKGQQWQLALRLFGGLPTARVNPDVISYNVSISSCEKGQQWQLALHLFCAMPTAKVDPDVVSYSAAISSCEKGQQWQLALHLFGGMSKAKLDPDVISYNASISSCEKGQQWQLALHLFGGMPKAKVDPNVISYSAAISSCEKGQQWQLALHLFGGMPKAKVDPNVISHNASISSCEKGQQWQLAPCLFGGMSKAKLDPTVTSYNSVLDCIFDKSHGEVLFAQALSLGLYDSRHKKGSGLLDLHDMSPGAAWMAVCCWLLEELPPLLSRTGPRSCTIITGFGKSRPMWREADNQAFIMNMLKSHGIPARIQPDNPGSLQIKLRIQDVSAFRDRVSEQEFRMSLPKGAWAN